MNELGLPAAGRARWGWLAFLFSTLTTGAVVAAKSMEAGWGLPAPVVAPTLVLASKLAVDRLAHWGRAPPLSIVTSLSTMLAAGLLCWSTWNSVVNEILSLEKVFLLDRRLVDLVTLMAFFPVSALGVINTARLFRSAWFRSATRLPGSGRALQVIALCGTGTLCLLVALGTLRACEVRDLDVRLRDMRSSGVTIDLDGRPGPRRRGAHEAKDYRHTAGDVTVVQECEHDWCHLGIVSGADAPGSSGEIDESAPHVENDSTLFVTHEDPDVVVVHAWLEPFASEATATIVAFKRAGDCWRAEAFGPGVVTRRASPPVPWIGCGLVGALLTLWPWGARRRAVHRGRLLASARAGTLSAEGWITVGEGPAVRVRGALAAPPGPVLVLAIPSNAGAYRDGLVVSAGDLVAGTHAEHAEATAREVHRHEAMVLAIACLAGAPLAAAAILGLLW